MLSKIRQEHFYNSLCCAQCQSSLKRESAERLICESCQSIYPVINGVPVIMTADSQRSLDIHLDTEAGLAMLQEYASSANAEFNKPSKDPWWVRALRPPPVMLNYRNNLRQKPTNVLFESADGKCLPLVLNVGGGPVRESEHEITLNVRPFHNVDLVADAHNIPLADNSVDAVFSLAVLEHVVNPQQVVNEMYRVLKPGGFMYSEVPFIFFFHGYPTDISRFTRDGVKYLFSNLDDLQVGMIQGPMSALLQSGNMVWEMIIPKRWPKVRKVFNGVYRWVFFPFKYFDLLLKNNADAHTLAGGFYALGRKPSDP